MTGYCTQKLKAVDKCKEKFEKKFLCLNSANIVPNRVKLNENYFLPIFNS